MTAQLSWLDGLTDAPRVLSAALGIATPSQQRDAVLEQHATRRRELIALADAVALDLVARDGSTCSVRILAEMRRRGLLPAGVDTRFAGAITLPSRGWVRTGELVAEGSRAAKVPLWARR